MRDHILGIRGVNGRGEMYRAGAAVVKNVTGYDLPKLMAGSFGTLTALSEVTVKVLPAPEETQTLLLTGRDEAAGVAALTRAMRSPYEVSGAAHLPASIAARSSVGRVSGAGGSVTLVRLEGFAPSVAARAAALTEELGTDALLDRADSLVVWQEVSNAAYFAADRSRHVWKLSVPPQDGPAVAASLRRSLDAEFWFDWAGGLLWVAVTPAEGEAELIRAAMPGTGHATLVRAPEAVRAATVVFQPLPEPLMALTRRVKTGFDPRGLFNPGRLYDGL
jgi:glycolate oxidase FAD binding subunit